MASQAVIDALYDEIVNTFDGATAQELSAIALRLMQLAQVQKGLTGPQKKELVVHVVKKIVNDSGLLKPEDLPAATLFIDVTLPGMIDVVKDVAKTGGALVATAAGKCCAVM